MAIVSWPALLPPLPLQDGYSVDRQSGLVRDDNYNGLVNVRRRFTAISKYHTVSVVMTKAEFLIFRDFFDFDIGAGTLPFYYTNPILQLGTIKARIKATGEPYSVSYANGSLDYKVAFVLEELPGTVDVFAFDEIKSTSDLYYKVTSEDEEKIAVRN